MLSKIWPSLGVFIGVILLSTLASCGTVSSGHYVEIRSDATSWESLARQYNVPVWRLKVHNPDLILAPGAWAFIPQDKGLLASLDQFGLGSAEDPHFVINTGKFIWPVPSSRRISSAFGWRHRRFHEGIDIPAASGTHILAAADGLVVYAGQGLSGYGNLTVIKHGQGIYTVYAHAKKNFTRAGQRVYKGEVIAAVGSTGRSTGPHLHFEVRRQGRAYNPVAFFKQK